MAACCSWSEGLTESFTDIDIHDVLDAHVDSEDESVALLTEAVCILVSALDAEPGQLWDTRNWTYVIRQQLRQWRYSRQHEYFTSHLY